MKYVLTEEDKAAIKEGLEQAERGEGVPFEQVDAEIREMFRVAKIEYNKKKVGSHAEKVRRTNLAAR